MERQVDMQESARGCGPATRIARVGWPVLVAAVAFGAYANALPNGFVYDDVPQVLQNPWIRDARSIPAIFTSGAWDYAGTSSNYYRPVMHLAYLAAHAIFGLWAPGFHLVNVLLHVVASVLVYLLAARILRPDGAGPVPGDRALAAAAGLLFAVHPIHTEAVAWVSAVPDLALTVFSLGSLLLYAALPSGRVPSLDPRYLASVGLFVLASLSKETALLLPAILATWDWAIRRERPASAARVKGYLPYLAVVAAYVLLRVAALRGVAPVSRHQDLTGAEVALNVLPLLARYAGMLLLPVGLTAFHGFRPVTSLLDPAALAATFAGLAVLAGGILLAVRGGRRAAFACALMVVPLLPVLYVRALGENPFAERYLYLPSAGFVLLLAIGATAVRDAWPRSGPALALGAAALLLACAVGTVRRNPVWATDLSLWQDAAAKSPDAPIPHYNLATYLQAEERLDEAAAEYRRAIALQPSPVAYASLGEVYRRLGRLDDAVHVLELALGSDPGYAPAHGNLGLAYLDLDRPGAALEHLEAAVALAPGDSALLNNLGRAYERAGMSERAARSYEAALRADPGNAVARRNLGALLGR